MTDPVAPADVVFVIHDQGQWWLTSTAHRSREAVGFDDVLALVGAEPSAPTEVAPRRAHPQVPDHTEVRPPWIVVGRLGSGGLVVADPDDHPVVLGPDHLAVLDRLDSPLRAADLVAWTRGTDPARALADLVAWRLVATSPGPEPADGTVDPVAQVTETETPQPPMSAWRRLRHRRRPDGAAAPTSPPAEPEPGAVADEPTPGLIGPTGSPAPGGPEGRIPVYAIWHEQVGPLLSLGMLTAAARHHRDGALNEVYEIRKPESAESFLADLATRTGPAVLLCSDYVWSLDDNLAAARAALAINPELTVIHGGPSCPKYEGDAETFLDQHGPVAHVLCRGEGEHLICELLDALAPSDPTAGHITLDPAALDHLDGITYRNPATGTTVRTADRPRITDLDALPSPYLTGEFDHIAIDAWRWCLSIETNRGCPYSCSYCDWGSATLSRIRMFSLDRVADEVRWAATRGVQTINLPDANFGIMSRDVDTARNVALIRAETGYPTLMTFYPAKNTTKHLTKIMDVLVEANVGTTASLSLQTSDPDTLEAIDRANIATDHYVALAADYRRRGYPLQGDLLLGLPGQSYQSYRRDLQFYFDHEVQARTWQLQILPNAPMNDPAYRERFQIHSDDQHRIRSTSTFTEEDRARMLRLRDVDGTCERLGVLRHVLRWLQWDHGIEATVVMDDLIDTIDTDPMTYPHLTWVFTWFGLHASAPEGWRPFYDDVRRYLLDRHSLPASTAMESVLELNRFLMPLPGRQFPASLDLTHDYLAYYRDATSSLAETGHAGKPSRPLADHGPGRFTIEADPLGLCTHGLRFHQTGADDGMEGDFSIGANSANELLSPLLRPLPHVIASGVRPPTDPAALAADLDERPAPQPVELGRGGRR